MNSVINLTLYFALLVLVSSQARIGDLFIARYNGTIKQSINELIVKSETFLRNFPQSPSHVQVLYQTKFGTILLHVMRPGSIVRYISLPTSEYIRVERGKLEFTGRTTKHLNQLDGIMFEGEHLYVLRNTDTQFTVLIQVKSPMKPLDKSVESKLYKPSSEKVQTDLKMGNLFVDGLSNGIDINQIGQRLINQQQRLASALVSINRGVSLTMFVLKGISGCHKHTRSDYIAWNGHGGSLQHLKFPEKFDTLLNDPVIMPLEVRHNLFSHNNESNIMLLFQFPAQSTSDSISETGCMEP